MALAATETLKKLSELHGYKSLNMLGWVAAFWELNEFWRLEEFIILVAASYYVH